jgi:ribulose-phosphate 3-epimerase
MFFLGSTGTTIFWARSITVIFYCASAKSETVMPSLVIPLIRLNYDSHETIRTSYHMKCFVSLWSADLLALGDSIDLLENHVEGFHLDVMDGITVPNLLFGPDFILAVRKRTKAILDVHVMLLRTDSWLERLAAAGSDILTIHRSLCPDVRATLERIRKLGKKAGLVVELNDPVDLANLHLDLVDRLLVMGTEIGVKGCDIDPGISDRIGRIANEVTLSGSSAEIFVDGGIRRQTIPMLAKTAADGVIPGSLVFGEKDPIATVRWIKSHNPKHEKAAA